MITPIILGSIIGITGGTITGNSIEFSNKKISINFKRGLEETNKNGFVSKMAYAGALVLGLTINEVQSEIVEQYKQDFREQMANDLYSVRDDIITREVEQAYNIQEKMGNKGAIELERTIEDMKSESDKYNRLEYLGLASLYGDKDYTYDVISTNCDEILDKTLDNINDYLDNVWTMRDASRLSTHTPEDFNDDFADLTADLVRTYNF